MEQVREFVVQEMRSQGLASYIGQAEPIIGSLEDRERAIAGNLIDFAESQGLTTDAARDAVEESGLTMPVASGNGWVSEDERAALLASMDELRRNMAELNSAVENLTRR